MHYCAHCNYQSNRKYNLKVHLRNKHKTVKEEVEDLAMQSVESSPTERMMHYCAHCDYKSDRMYNLKVHQSRKHNVVKEEVEDGSKIIHFCTQCNYQSDDKWCVRRHQSRKHKMVKEEVKECPLPPADRELMEDSIQVFKIYKLLQRMKNK